jgi:DNA polymerase III delta prime subunit
MSGSCIVYILDECHKFTNEMQNALLKPLEDTPDHVYFFLCTTDPQKLISALLSRCTEIKFSLLSDDLIQKLIRKINRKENFGLSPEIIEKIAEKAGGCPRKGLVILERISTLDSEEKQKQYLKENYIGDEDIDVIELCRLLLQENSSWKSISSLLKKLDAEKKLVDSESIRYLVLSYMNSVLLNGKVSERAVGALEAFSESTYNTSKYGITLACLKTIL